MRVLKFVIFSVSVCAMVGGFFNIPPISDRGEKSQVSVSADAIRATLNERRIASECRPLEMDADLMKWAETTLPIDLSNPVTANELLERLQEEVNGVAAASAGVFRTPSRGQAWMAELADWDEPEQSQYTHLAVIARDDDPTEETYLWVILVQRFPEFAPELLSEGLQHFHHTCARCSHGYNGQFYGGNRILLLQCPECKQNYDILAANTTNRYRRANAYFSHLAPPAAFPVGMSKLEEMNTIWKSVLDHCEYENDYDPDGIGPAKDAWQTSAETWQRRSGDCEDSSILLADWLISRGIEARVVIGETKALQGHAWCVARVDGEVYLLETTVEKHEASQSPPLASELVDRYRPEYEFDRDRLYFFTGDRGELPGDSWDPALWHSVAYTSPETLSVPTFHGSPWFDDHGTAEVSPIKMVGSKAAPTR